MLENTGKTIGLFCTKCPSHARHAWCYLPSHSFHFFHSPLVSCYFCYLSRKMIGLLITPIFCFLSKCLQGCMHCSCYLVQKSGKAGLFSLIIFATIIQQTISLCASPVGCTNDFYADITALELFSSCWTVWWNSYEAGHRQGVNSNTATTAITFITALHLANLNTFAPLCCSNLKITHTNHHHRCWCIWML